MTTRRPSSATLSPTSRRRCPTRELGLTLRKETLGRILATLSTRDRRILELRYGLNDDQPRTLTRERIRQLETRGLKKLRTLADAQTLRETA